MTDSFAWSDDSASRARLRAELRQRGYSLLSPTEQALPADLAAREPWEAAGRLLGERPELVECQPIASVPWGKSFASTSVDTPLHSDSQLYSGAAPDLQLMFCERAATLGGETTLLDTWALLDSIERDDLELHCLLFEAIRRIPFVFGEVVGPTVSLRRGAMVFTHSPMPLPDDSIARRLMPHVERARLTRVKPEAGQILVVDNHRMLHGRSAFADPARKFTRILAWVEAPLACPERLRALAERALQRYEQELPARALRQLGIIPPDPRGAVRRRIVLEMLRGVAPGVLARRYDVDEAQLYAWRDRTLAAADQELAQGDDEHAAALAALARLSLGG